MKWQQSTITFVQYRIKHFPPFLPAGQGGIKNPSASQKKALQTLNYLLLQNLIFSVLWI